MIPKCLYANFITKHIIHICSIHIPNKTTKNDTLLDTEQISQKKIYMIWIEKGIGPTFCTLCMNTLDSLYEFIAKNWTWSSFYGGALS